MTRLDITRAYRLIHLGRDMRFEGRRNSELDFVSDRTGERLVLTDAELAAEVAAGRAQLIRLESKPRLPSPEIADLAMFPAEAKEAARRRLAYVEAVYKRFGSGPIPKAALKTVVNQMAHDSKDPAPPNHSTIRRWLARTSERHAISQLVSAERAKGNRRDRLTPEVRQALDQLINEKYLAEPPISVTTLHAELRDKIKLLNSTNGTAHRCPSYEAVREAVGRLDLAVTAGRREGPAAARRYSATFRQRDPKAPLDRVELDHTVADLFVVGETNWLPIGRPTIAFAIDRCTRMPFGLYIGFEPPSVHTVLQCLRNGMLPKLYLAKKVELGEWDIKHDWPVCGRPRVLVLDRARENLGVDLAEFAGEVGVHLHFMPRKSPWYKGAIERFLGTVNKRLLHEQRGTTFSNILERKDYDSSKNAVITLNDLQFMIHKWMLDVYANGEHKGIRDIPARRWAELVQRYPVDPIESITELDGLLGRIERRCLTRHGIQFEYLLYSSEELVLHIANPAFHKAAPDRFVRFRYDPADLKEIRVMLPHLHRYLTVPITDAWRDYATGLSIWQHRTILEFERRRTEGAIDRDGLAEAKAYLSERFGKFLQDRRSKGRSKAARFAGIGRLAPAGDATHTSPPGSMDAESAAQPSRQRGKSSPKERSLGLKLLSQEVLVPEGMRAEDVDVYGTPRK